jgi:hypothetical protein
VSFGRCQSDLESHRPLGESSRELPRRAYETPADHALLNFTAALGWFRFGGGTLLKDFPELGDSFRL